MLDPAEIGRRQQIVEEEMAKVKEENGEEDGVVQAEETMDELLAEGQEEERDKSPEPEK